jgi:histidinol phosphatase-like enzyme (inositol monophosphatase family)
MSFLPLKTFALRLAEAARGETMKRWSNGIAADNKAAAGKEFDPVTEADREAERAIRRLIEAEYPDHGISGEEFPERASQGRYRWSLDPIDGTRSFICGMPTWVTLIALLDDGVPAIGLIDAPRLDELYLGDCDAAVLISRGEERPLKASGCPSLSNARFSTTDPFLFAGADADAFAAIRSRVRTTRYGHDGYGYARLAAGTIDLVVESGLNSYDLNALVPVVRGAGGMIGDWSGGSDFSAGQVVAAATPQLFQEALALLRQASRV